MDGCPDEHGSPGFLYLPARPVETIYEDVPSVLIKPGLFRDVGPALPQGYYTGNLHRLEYAIIVVALYTGQGLYNLAIPYAETQPPARHVKYLGHGVKFYAHLLGPFYLEETRGFVPIKGRTAVGKVVDDYNVIPTGNVHYLFKKTKLHGHGSRVVRKI